MVKVTVAAEVGGELSLADWKKIISTGYKTSSQCFSLPDFRTSGLPDLLQDTEDTFQCDHYADNQQDIGDDNVIVKIDKAQVNARDANDKG
jgi:hypothetical protein